MQHPGKGFTVNHGILVKYDKKLPSKSLHKGLLLLQGLVDDVGWGAFSELLLGGSQVAPEMRSAATPVATVTMS
jgi:hypothetical protein